MLSLVIFGGYKDVEGGNKRVICYVIRDPKIKAPSTTTIGNMVGDVAFDAAVVDATN